MFRAFTIALIASAALCTSCGSSTNKEALKVQTLLDDAERALSQADYKSSRTVLDDSVKRLAKTLYGAAGDKAQDAIVSLEQAEGDISTRIILARARILLFRAYYTPVIQEKTDGLPDKAAYSIAEVPYNYDNTIGKAISELKSILADPKLDKEQEGGCHSYLGNCYRFLAETAADAAAEFDLAIASYQARQNELEKDAKAHSTKIAQLNEYQNQLVRNKVQSLMTVKDYESALNQLEKVGKTRVRDLSHIRNQVSDLDKQVTQLQEKAMESRQKWGGSLSEQVGKINEERRKENVDKLIRAISTEIERKQNELDLVLEQLVYRVICYHNLGADYKKSEDEGRAILKTFFPDVESGLGF